MPDKIFLLLLVIFAILSVNTAKLRQAVIYLGLFSLISSFVYLIYGAPDVAIAQAAIGSAISTVLYLVAIRRSRVFTVYFIRHSEPPSLLPPSGVQENQANPKGKQPKKANHKIPPPKRENSVPDYELLLKSLEQYLMKMELEPHVIFTYEPSQSLLKKREYDLVLKPDGNKLQVFGFSSDYHLDQLEQFFSQDRFKSFHITVARQEEGVLPNAQID